MAGIKRWLMARKWVIQEVLQVQAPDTPIPGGGQMTPHTLHVSYVFGDDGWHLYTWEADGPHVDDQGEIVDGDDATIHGDRAFAYPGECDNGDHDGSPASDPPEWVVDLARERAVEHPAPPPLRPETGPEVARPAGLDDLLNYVADNLEQE